MTDLTVQPTIAMREGKQSVFQCSACGTVVVQAKPASHQLGACPSCSSFAAWWRQELPIAALEVSP